MVCVLMDILQFWNLHDVFLNAMVQRQAMNDAPIIDDVERFHVSNRARFERAWAVYLYVLIESWNSNAMSGVRSFVSDHCDISELKAVLVTGQETGAIEKLRMVRHYMCHRDHREYFDKGSLGRSPAI